MQQATLIDYQKKCTNSNSTAHRLLLALYQLEHLELRDRRGVPQYRRQAIERLTVRVPPPLDREGVEQGRNLSEEVLEDGVRSEAFVVAVRSHSAGKVDAKVGETSSGPSDVVVEGVDAEFGRVVDEQQRLEVGREVAGDALLSKVF